MTGTERPVLGVSTIFESNNTVFLRAGRKPHPSSIINALRSSIVGARVLVIDGGAKAGHIMSARSRISVVVSGRGIGYLTGLLNRVTGLFDIADRYEPIIKLPRPTNDHLHQQIQY